MSQSKQVDVQLLTLTTLLSLHERTRPAGLQELKFIAVNELKPLLDYSQAVLIKKVSGESASIQAISGIPDVDQNIPFTLFLKRLFKHIESEGLCSYKETSELTSSLLNDDVLKEEWNEWLPKGALWLSFPKSGYVLFLAKQKKWDDRDHAISEKLVTIFDEEFLQKAKSEDRVLSGDVVSKVKKMRWKIGLVVIFILLFPFKTSVLAPAEVIAQTPSLIRAPLDGIIASIDVVPNQNVKAGDILFRFDLDILDTQIEISKNALNVAKSELRQASQEALNDSSARLRVSVLQGKVKTELTNLLYAEELLSKAEVVAPNDGVVIFEDVFDWLGRPVSTGERVMLLAQADQTELEIRLPIHDAIPVKNNAQAKFFSNARPDTPINATLREYSYRATTSDFGEVSYQLKAEWDTGAKLEYARLGLKGTAKLYGERQPLLLQILRRPLVEVRKWLGL